MISKHQQYTVPSPNRLLPKSEEVNVSWTEHNTMQIRTRYHLLDSGTKWIYPDPSACDAESSGLVAHGKMSLIYMNTLTNGFSNISGLKPLKVK